MEDEIISDPFFSSLLNENREIIVGDSIYKYTELGLYFCKKEFKNKMYEYLEKMTPSERKIIIAKNKNAIGIKNSKNIIIEDLGNGIKHFNKILPPNPCKDGDCGGGGYYPPIQQPILDAKNLQLCVVQDQGFFEHIFGVSEDCHSYYDDDRRVQTTFWNQNYFVYGSIGTSVRLQKHMTPWYASWWEKSYAEKIQLGVNYISYKYNFNVPNFNQQEFNYSNTFFEYNGIKYNINGQIVPNVPTGSGNFQFNTNNQQKVIDITVLGYNLMLDNGQVNNYVDQILNQLISFISAYDVKQELLTKKASGDLKVNIIYAVPFANSVKFYTTDVAWKANDEHVITNYFDFNFTFTYKNSYGSTGDYLSGLQGASTYTEVKTDLYGAALHNNVWRGNRLTYSAE